MSGENEDKEMWSYWRNKRGIVEALEADYPETLKANPVLVALIAQIKSAEVMIDKIMTEGE